MRVRIEVGSLNPSGVLITAFRHRTGHFADIAVCCSEADGREPEQTKMESCSRSVLDIDELRERRKKLFIAGQHRERDPLPQLGRVEQQRSGRHVEGASERVERVSRRKRLAVLEVRDRRSRSGSVEVSFEVDLLPSALGSELTDATSYDST
jgi:hypothetical protein